MRNLETKIKFIISEKLGVSSSELTPETNLVDDLGATPVEIADLLAAIEEKLSIAIPEEGKEKIKTVGRIIRLFTSQATDLEDK